MVLYGVYRGRSPSSFDGLLIGVIGAYGVYRGVC